MGNIKTGCTCGSGGHPRDCKLHPELYRLHIAELNLEGAISDDPSAQKAMDEMFKATSEALKIRNNEISKLQELVFKSVPTYKSSSLRRLWSKGTGHVGVTDYELWIRKLEWSALQHLIKLHTGAIDALRLRRRFLENEAERRHLHSEYGKHPLEVLFDPHGGIP